MNTTELLDHLVVGGIIALWGFMGTMIGFDIYNLVPAFNWIFDFVLIEGTVSSNLKWSVAIVILTFVRIVLTFLVFAAMFGVFGDNDESWLDDDEATMFRLIVISVLYLGLTLPPWVAVLRRGWGDVMREAGHGLDAGRVDIYWRFGIAVIIFWGVILVVCMALLLGDLLIQAWKWGQRKLRQRQTSKPQDKAPKKGDRAPNQDVEKGGVDSKDASFALKHSSGLSDDGLTRATTGGPLNSNAPPSD